MTKMTKDQFFEFLVLMGTLEYQLESFAEKVNNELLKQENNKAVLQ